MEDLSKVIESDKQILLDQLNSYTIENCKLFESTI